MRTHELRALSLLGLPNTNKTDKEIVRETRVQHLADQEDVRAESRLEHDRHVGSVEQTNRVGSTHAPLAGRLDRDFNAEALEVDNSGENQESGK
jgi:hypothetical protein